MLPFHVSSEIPAAQHSVKNANSMERCSLMMFFKSSFGHISRSRPAALLMISLFRHVSNCEVRGKGCF